MTKRVIDDDEYLIIPKKCVSGYKQNSNIESSDGGVWFVIFVFLLCAAFGFILFMSTQHGFYFNPDGSMVQY